MNELFNGRLLLGRPDRGELILMIGPAYARMKETAEAAGFETRDVSDVQDIQMLRAGLTLSGESLVILASASEVEGRLDRAAFGPLSDLAYEADRVIYGGTRGQVVMHPISRGTEMSIHGGSLSLRYHFNAIDEGGQILGLTPGAL